MRCAVAMTRFYKDEPCGECKGGPVGMHPLERCPRCRGTTLEPVEMEQVGWHSKEGAKFVTLEFIVRKFPDDWEPVYRVKEIER